MADQLEPTRTGRLHAGAEEIFWEYFGQGDRETIVLLNGLAMHTRAWYSFLPRLTDAFDVLLYDYPGQGQSTQEDRPCSIPCLGDYLVGIADRLRIECLHVAGISYGGFVALDLARLHQDRLATLTVSGILLSRETLFQMYQDLSLRFYRGSLELFEVYTHYLYEKIFGEAFAQACYGNLEPMRSRFYDRYKESRHSLIRLTEAQIPFFAELEANLDGYRAIRTPTLVLAGAEDRAIPPGVQRKICDILPCSRFEAVNGSGHCVYVERPDVFFGRVKAFARTRSFDHQGARRA
jgi:3-oxoadipate enol-lactonase